jgi:hypothetical protein
MSYVLTWEVRCDHEGCTVRADLGVHFKHDYAECEAYKLGWTSFGGLGIKPSQAKTFCPEHTPRWTAEQLEEARLRGAALGDLFEGDVRDGDP